LLIAKTNQPNVSDPLQLIPIAPIMDRSEELVDLTNYLMSILISLAVGLVGFILAYKIFDWLTPGVNFADQLNADNRSVAIFLAGLFIGLGLLLGNAIK
jgi:uncharacterized membrane protein YjfL (UPF0719 family)